MKLSPQFSTFNRGRISSRALGRPDVDRVNLSAEVMTNWIPGKLGYMTLRPGTEFIGESKNAVFIPFVFSRTDFAALEVAQSGIRVWNGGTDLVERPGVSATITNGSFESDISGWTDDSDSGASVGWLAGMMRLSGTGYNSARAYQAVSISDQGTLHSLDIRVDRGPVYLRIGTTAGADNVRKQIVLRAGVHSIGFIPNSATVYVELSSPLRYPVRVDRCDIEPAGILQISTPWPFASLSKIRHEQINDVVFLACEGYPPKRLERRDNDSWSLVDYQPSDGPFLPENAENITLTPTAISGSITVTSSRKFFRDGHLGALFQMVSSGQQVSSALAAEDTYTNAINVQGTGDAREFGVAISGTWSGTLQLFRSIGAEGAWIPVKTYSGAQSVTHNDELDNVIAYYRVGFSGGNYSSGTANVTITFDGGSVKGVVRVTTVTNATTVNAVVLKDLGGTDATAIWSEGAWSDEQGWPTSVAMYEGRLSWQGQGRNWLSVSDGLDSFDPDYEGDAGPISKYIGDGSVERVNWTLPMQRLLIGTDDGEFSVRASSIDEVLTASNYNSKQFGTNGSATIQAVRMDDRAVMIQAGGERVIELAFDATRNDYTPVDLSILCPEIGRPGIVRIAARNNPSSSLYCVRSDGTVAVMIRDPAEDVRGFVDIEMSGFVKDVFVLPGDGEDHVFFLVRHEIDGETLHYLERMVTEQECIGGPMNKNLDCHVTFDGGVANAVLVPHLEGREVQVWGNGADLGTFTVSGGQISLPGLVSTACVGLPYEASYKSTPPVPFYNGGSLQGQEARIDYIGLRLVDTHWQGIEFGPSFEDMDGLPWEGRAEEYTISGGVIVPGGATFPKPLLSFGGGWELDARIHLKARSPRPCTVLSYVVRVDSAFKW